MVTFEWDDKKATSNLARHSVSFTEAETVFYDPRSLTIPDPDHSDDEKRFIDIGVSDRGRILIVVYTERRTNIRLISARKATRAERKIYEQEK